MLPTECSQLPGFMRLLAHTLATSVHITELDLRRFRRAYTLGGKGALYLFLSASRVSVCVLSVENTKAISLPAFISIVIFAIASAACSAVDAAVALLQAKPPLNVICKECTV